MNSNLENNQIIVAVLFLIVTALVSDLPPLKEIISDYENGFLFKSENVSDLTNKLNSIFSDKRLIEQLRTKGTELIKTKYD